MRAIENESHYLGLGMANLVTMFVPEIIVLGGSVMNSSVLFWKEFVKLSLAVADSSLSKEQNYRAVARG